MSLGETMVILGSEERQEPAGTPRAATESMAVTAVVVDGEAIILLLPAGPVPVAAGRVGAGLAWRALGWGGGGLALVTGARLGPGALAGASVQGDDGPAWPVPEVTALEVDPAALARHVQASGGSLAAVLGFLRDGFGPTPGPRRAGFLRGFLEAGAEHGGFIEIVAAPEGGGLLLQGWAQAVQPGKAEIGIVADGLEVHEAAIATFERADLLAPATGIVAFVKDVDPGLAGRVGGAFIDRGGSIARLDRVAQGAILIEGPEAAAHLAAMLPRVAGPAPALRALRRVCRPRFAGIDTLSTAEVPVRAALDLVLASGDGGHLVLGWLLDPEQRVTIAALKSTHGQYCRLEQRWVRLPRPDLNDGFQAHPLFADRLRPHDRLHGFLCWAPPMRPPVAGDQLYLELVQGDESCLFLPVPAVVPAPLVSRHLPRLLAAISLDEPELGRIVADHLAPFVRAQADARPLPQPLGQPVPLGTPPALPAASLVVPIGADWTALEVMLARLAIDPELQSVELVLVAHEDEIRPVAQRLARAVGFYGLGGALVLTAEPLDRAAAIDVGAGVARGDWLMCLPGAVLPDRPGWLGPLIAALAAAPEAGLAAPTLLYEDRSIRWAGTHPDAPLDPSAAARFAGYPESWLEQTGPRPARNGPAECFLVRRELLRATGGVEGRLLGPDWRHLDLAARLHAAGRTCLWVPEVRLWALDDPQGEEPHWRKVARLVDRSICARLDQPPPLPAREPA
jgi:hypothetical protein